ncbi:MAG TPA: hypothetical protein VK466_02385 [Terriglobales bacterium]|nr:hypothetical protein [Terriglobales bacterium]
MSLKILSIACISAVLAIPQLAAAAEPPAPADLGQLESILDSCAAAKPKEAENYKKQRKKLTEGMAEKDVAKIRESQPYKEAYDVIQQRFQQASADEVDDACNVIAGRK